MIFNGNLGDLKNCVFERISHDDTTTGYLRDSEGFVRVFCLLIAEIEAGDNFAARH